MDRSVRDPGGLPEPVVGASGPGLPPGGVLPVDPALARVHVELAARVAERTQLTGAGSDVTAITDIGDTLSEVLRLCVSILGGCGGVLSLYDSPAERLLVVASEGVGEGYVTRLGELPEHGGAWAGLLSSRDVVLVEDTASDPRYATARDVPALGGYRAVCCLPLTTAAEDFVGAVDVYFPDPGVPDGRQVGAALAHARQAGEFVARARLHGQALVIARREQARNAQLGQLAEAALALTGAQDLDEVLQTVTEAARRTIGTHQAVTSRLPHGWSDATTAVSLSDKYAAWRSYDVPPKGLGVLNAVTREQKPLRLTGEELARHPDWRGLSDAPGHPPLPDYLAAPLVARDGTNLGLVQLADKVDGTPFSEEDEAILVQLAQAASGAIETLELLAEERSRSERADRIGAVAAALAEAATTEDVIDVLTDAVLTTLGADGVLVSLLEGGRLVPAGSRGYPPEVLARLAAVPLGADLPLAHAARERRPLFLGRWEEVIAGYPGALVWVDGSARGSRACLPLTASGQLVGVWALTFVEERRFSSEEQVGLMTLAGVAAQALARAAMHQAEHDMAIALQRALLPQQLPDLEYAEVAGRYLPARTGVEVGGDWYDVIALPGGSVALVIGDVQGHSSAAAAVMGQVRNTLRAYAIEGHPPATVVARTNRLLCGLETSLFATCCYIALDPATSTAEVVRAGHHDPVLVPAEGHPRALPSAGGLPLGLDAEELYPTTSVRLDLGDLLALYTDGLVEPLPEGAAGEDGTAQLLAQAAALDGGDVEDLADELLELTARASGRPDDVALLLVRYTGRAADRQGRTATLEVAADPSSPRAGRRWLRRTLEDWDLAELVDAGELLLTEALTNAVVHGEGAVEVSLCQREAGLRVEVVDASSRRPVRREHADDATSGRGLVLLDAVARDWGVEPRGDGKCVWFELDATS